MKHVLGIVIAALLLLMTPATAGIILMPTTAPFVGACDTITAGCAVAYSMSAKLRSAYAGKAFELVNETPDWVGTGTVAAGVLTVVTTTSGTPTIGEAVSAVGSGATPKFKPVTYITGGTGPYTLSDNSVTIGSATAIKTYPVLDVAFVSNSWDPTTWQAFCSNATCGVLKIFNEGSATASGALSSADIIASEVNTGVGSHPDCTSTIVVCAPLFAIYAPTNSALAIAVNPAIMSINAGATSGVTVSGTPSGTGSKSIDFVGLNTYTSSCCGSFGIGDLNPNSVVSGSMFSQGFALSGGTQVAGVDYEASATWLAYDSNIFQHAVLESRYLSSGNTITLSFNGTDYSTGNTPGQTINTSAGFINLGAGGDYSEAPLAFEAGWISPDNVSHATAATTISSYWAAQSAATCSGPLDLGWYQPSSALGSGSPPSLVGNGQLGYALRPLSAWYSGPIVKVTNNVSQTKTFAGVGCNIDPAMNAFCTGGNSPCHINTLYNQAWNIGASTAIGNVPPNASSGLDMIKDGSYDTPTIDYTNTLGGQPTIALNGSQALCTTNGIGTGTWVTASTSYEASIVTMRTGNFTGGSAFAAQNGGNQNTPLIYFAGANQAQFGEDPLYPGPYTASDSHWHELQLKKGAGGGSGFTYIDGSATTAAFTNSDGQVDQTQICLGTNYAATLAAPLTGNIAEAVVLVDTGTLSNADANHTAAVLANDQAYYGVTFPH